MKCGLAVLSSEANSSMFSDFSLSLLIFRVGVGGVLGHYTGYPAGNWLLSRVFGRPQLLPNKLRG